MHLPALVTPQSVLMCFKSFSLLQLVLAEIVKRSSEVILEIIDMKDAPKRVIDIAIEIEEDVSVRRNHHIDLVIFTPNNVPNVIFMLLFICDISPHLL